MRKNISIKLLTTLLLSTALACGPNSNQDALSYGADDQSYYESAECLDIDIKDLPDQAYISVPYIEQNENYCGPASLAMVLGYYGEEVSQEVLGEGIVGELGVTTRSLSAKAEEYGFKVDVYSCRIETLLYYVSKDVPVIARIVNSTSTNGHFVTVIGYDLVSKMIYLNDPAIYNNVELKISEFVDVWDVRTLEKDNNSWNQMILVRP